MERNEVRPTASHVPGSRAYTMYAVE